MKNILYPENQAHCNRATTVRLAYLLHIIPVGDDTVLNGVLEGKDTSLRLGFVSDVAVLLAHTDHHTLVAGTADNGGEDGAGSIITGETGLAHTGAIVYDKSGNIVVTHDEFGLESRLHETNGIKQREE